MAKGPEIWVCPQCGFRMDIAPLGLYAEVQCPRCFRADRVHAQLSNFRLDGVIGVGGMSVVYRAFDVVLHRALALKVLNDTFRDQPERIERFENESAMMARVRHENVTSVYSAGRAYGQFYIAMELIEGKNLEYMVSAEQPMGAMQALDIIRQVASGLQAANEAGLLHRDMKPGNILITPEGLAKVIDFGLAMDSREDDTEEIIWATPYYVPPETLQRNPEDVRTDIYALGMTLRFLLTGVERFDVEATSLQALIQRKRKLVPLAKQNYDIPPALADLVDHMTEFSPSDRPASYADLLAEITEVQQELTISRAPAAKRRGLLLRVGSLALGFALGLGLGVLCTPSAGQKKRELIPLPAATKQEVVQDTVTPSVLEMLESKDYAGAVSALLSASEKATDPCLGAWYAQLARTILGSCRNDPPAVKTARDLLARHLSNGSRVLPSGETSFRELKKMDPRRYPDSAAWASGESEWNSITRAELVSNIEELEKSSAHPVLRLINWYVLAEKAAWLGFTELSNRCMTHVKDTSSLGEYEVLSEMLSAPSIHRRASGTKSELSRAEASMHERDFATAMARFSSLADNDRLDDQARAQARVLREVCETAQAMFETLRRKAPARYRVDMSDEELVALARGLSPASRPSTWASSTQPGHQPKDALDGQMDTYWSADTGSTGNNFVLDIDTPDPLSDIILHWTSPQRADIRVNIYAEGRAYSQEFTRSSKSVMLDIPSKVVDRIEICFNNTDSQACGIAEVQLVTTANKTIVPDSMVGKNDFADELRAVLLMIGGRYAEAFSQMDFIAARQGAQSPFSILVADWQKRWREANGGSNLAMVPNSEKLQNEQIIRMCNNCVLVRVLPGKQVRFRNRTVPLREGNMMFCSTDIAEALKKKGDIDVLPDDVVAILGLKGMRYNTYAIVPGEIQPCRKSDALHFQELGAGKIVQSADDLWDVRDKMKPDPFPIMLRRIVDL